MSELSSACVIAKLATKKQDNLEDQENSQLHLIILKLLNIFNSIYFPANMSIVVKEAFGCR